MDNQSVRKFYKLAILVAISALGAESPLVERVDKTAFIQIDANSFRSLAPQQQALAYWLAQASIAIEPITYDQFSRFGLKRKRFWKPLSPARTK